MKMRRKRRIAPAIDGKLMIEPPWQKAVTSGDDSQLPVAAINTHGLGCDAG
jgi:hypothetical protein